MNEDKLRSFHSVLKDRTRRDIIHLLNEKGSLCYTDLLENLQVVSTGLLNYHLKVLGNIVLKNDKGEYVLSEKGKLALQLLGDLPEEEGILKKMHRWERKFWKIAVVFLIGISFFNLIAYFLGFVTITFLYQTLIGAVPVICAIYVFEHFMRDVVSDKIRRKYVKINYYARSVVFGFFLWFGLIFILFLTGIGRQNAVVNSPMFFIIMLSVFIVVGHCVNKWDVERRNLCEN